MKRRKGDESSESDDSDTEIWSYNAQKRHKRSSSEIKTEYPPISAQHEPGVPSDRRLKPDVQVNHQPKSHIMTGLSALSASRGKVAKRKTRPRKLKREIKVGGIRSNDLRYPAPAGQEEYKSSSQAQGPIQPCELPDGTHSSPLQDPETAKTQSNLIISNSSQTVTNPNIRLTHSQPKRAAVKRTPTSTKTKKESAPTTPRVEGNCPLCQLPFTCLGVAETPNWHVTDCMSHCPSSRPQQECPAGVQCVSTIQSHYRKYQHTVLAKFRAGMEFQREGSSSVRKAVRQLDFSQPSTSKSEIFLESDNIQLNQTVGKEVSSQQQAKDVSKIGADSVSQTTSPYFKKRQAHVQPSSQILVEPKGLNSQHSQSDRLLSSPAQDRSTKTSEQQLEDGESEGESDEDIFAPDNAKKHTKNNDKRLEVNRTGDATEKAINENVGMDSESDTSFDKDVSELLHDICGEEPEKPGASQSEASELEDILYTHHDINQVELKRKYLEKEENEDTNEDGEGEDALSEADFAEPFTVELGNANGIVAELSNNMENQSIPFTSIIPCTPNSKEPDKDMTNISHSHISSTTSPRSTQSRAHTMSMQSQRSITDFFGHKSQSLKKQQKQKPFRPSTSKSGSVTKPASFDDSTSRGGMAAGKGAKRPCPFYKKIPGTPFTVDAFKYGSIPGCRAYILSHFHYDHYGGLTKRFAHPIYCSKITANLVKKKVRVEEKYLHALLLDTPTVIEGVEVTFMEANHCPGAVIIRFKLPNGQMFLHTGDFRACPAMEQYRPLVDTHIHQLYLDTTYCDPSHSFPPQQEVIDFAVRLASESLKNDPETLIVIGSYTIGKERIFIAIAEALNSCVCVTREKQGILECLEDASLSRRLTLKPQEASVHVLPMNQLSCQSLQAYLSKQRPKFNRILAIRPTGWTHTGPQKNTGLEKIRPQKRGDVSVYGLPYSEHSSYTEMKRFCQFIRPDNILPTVNIGSAASRKNMERFFREWMQEEVISPSKQLKQSGIKGWFH